MEKLKQDIAEAKHIAIQRIHFHVKLVLSVQPNEPVNYLRTIETAKVQSWRNPHILYVHDYNSSLQYLIVPNLLSREWTAHLYIFIQVTASSYTRWTLDLSSYPQCTIKEWLLYLLYCSRIWQLSKKYTRLTGNSSPYYSVPLNTQGNCRLNYGLPHTTPPYFHFQLFF